MTKDTNHTGDEIYSFRGLWKFNRDSIECRFNNVVDPATFQQSNSNENSHIEQEDVENHFTVGLMMAIPNKKS